MVAEKLAPFMAAGGPHVVLLNNLGGASVLEMRVLAHELAQLRDRATASATSSARRR